MGQDLSDSDLGHRADLLQPFLPLPNRREALPNGGYSLVGGAPPRVVLRLTPSGLRVGPAKVRPWGQRGVLVEGRLAAASWGELPSDDAQLIAVVGPLVAAATAMAAPEARTGTAGAVEARPSGGEAPALAGGETP